MPLDNLKMDVRYALRGIRRAPLFSASVAATIGLGLGVVCSAFTILNAYVLRTINLPNPEACVRSVLLYVCYVPAIR